MTQYSPVMRASSIAGLNTSHHSHEEATPKGVRWSCKHNYLFSPIDNEELCSPITEEEISTAISQMKNGKALALDGISSEVLKLGG